MKKSAFKNNLKSAIMTAFCLCAPIQPLAAANHSDLVDCAKLEKSRKSVKSAEPAFKVISSKPCASLTAKFMEPSKQFTKSFSSLDHFPNTSDMAKRVGSDEHIERNDYSWSGADAAYSVPLSHTKTLWLFGDTFLRAKVSTKCGKVSRPLSMLHNSAGLMQIDHANAPLAFFWQKEPDANNDLLQPDQSGTWLWPLDGTILDGTLYEFVNVLEKAVNTDPAFSFESVGQKFLSVSNPDDVPSKWKYKQVAVEAPGMQIGNAVTTDDTYLYIFCSYDKAKSNTNQHPQIVARVPLRDLHNLAAQNFSVSSWEFWCHRPSALPTDLDVRPKLKTSIASQGESPSTGQEKSAGIWARPTEANPMVIIPDGAPEFTVTHVGGFDGYFSIYFPAGFGQEIMMRHAPNPAGPWSKPQCIYHCPVDAKHYFVYSAKNHPELCSRAGQLCVTYCVNLKSTNEDLRAKKVSAASINRPEQFYYPHAVKIQLEKSNLSVTSSPLN